MFVAGIFLLFGANAVFAAERIDILLVPGHDDATVGAAFGRVKEADMNMRVAEELKKILDKDKRFKVWITRGWSGYTKTFADYFAQNRDMIIAFTEEAKKRTAEQKAAGTFIESEIVPHNTVSTETGIILYGINKWAQENAMDAVIHIHFNDYPRANIAKRGEYAGFTVYFPESQLPNATITAPLAGEIFSELVKKYPTSTHEKEKGGLIPDQKLIALGSHGTLPGVPSVLIEYGYIYEKRFSTYAKRQAAYKDMALRTASALKKFFK